METNAFERAQKFLSYHPVAKWLAILSSVGTAVLYAGMLATLALFIDLMVNRGEIASFQQLPAAEKSHFLQELALPDDEPARSARLKEVHDAFKQLGVAESNAKDWFAGKTADHLTHRELSVLWLVQLPGLMTECVGERAGQLVSYKINKTITRRGLDAAIYQPLEDFGLLSLVVRSHSTYRGWLVCQLASWNDWMWRYGDTYYLSLLFVLASILVLLRFGLMFLSNYMAALSTIEAVTRMRRAIYHHTHRLGTLAFRALGPSEAVSVSTRHLEGVHDGLYLWLTVAYRDPVKFGLTLLFALLVNFWLSLAFLLFAVLVWIVGGQVATYFRGKGRIAELRSADQLALIQESLMLMRLVKVYLMELFNQSRVERQLSGYAQAQLQRYRGEAIYRPLFVLLGLFASLLLMFVAGYVVLQGQLGVTSAVTLTIALVSLYWPSVRLLDARRSLRRSRDSARVLFSFLDRTGGVGQAIGAEFLPGLANVLEFDKVTLKEPGTGRKLLRGVSLSIRAGTRVALVGLDDMEKQSLVYLLPRFLDPTTGEIRVDGKNLRWVTLDSLRAQIAFVMQHNLVFNDTVANNIGCGDTSYPLPRVIEAAKLAHAHQFIQNLPQGYETPIGEMGHALNLGEKFRVALARAILRDPALFVLEEPPTSLDDDTKAMIDDTLQRVLPGRTVIFLPHRLSTIKSCDQVFLLHNGKIEAAGDHRELLESNDLYRHLVYLEFSEFASLAAATSPITEEAEL